MSVSCPSMGHGWGTRGTRGARESVIIEFCNCRSDAFFSRRQSSVDGGNSGKDTPVPKQIEHGTARRLQAVASSRRTGGPRPSPNPTTAMDGRRQGGSNHSHRGPPPHVGFTDQATYCRPSRKTLGAVAGAVRSGAGWFDPLRAHSVFAVKFLVRTVARMS